MADGNDFLALEGFEKPSYTLRWDPTFFALLPFEVIQPFWRNELEGTPVEQVASAAASASTDEQTGDPNLSALFQIQEVKATLVTDGLAFGTIRRRRYDIPPPPVGELADPSAWVERGIMSVRRYFDTSGTLATSANTQCNGASVDIPVPYAIFAVREAATQTKPSGIFSGVGSFTTIEGASMMTLTPELRVYEVGTTVQYVLTRFYEWRATAPVNGWESHGLSTKRQLMINTVT